MSGIPVGARHHTATLTDGTEIVHYGVVPDKGWFREGYKFRDAERSELTVEYAAELAAVALDPGYRPPVFVSTELPGGKQFDRLFLDFLGRRRSIRSDAANG